MAKEKFKAENSEDNFELNPETTSEKEIVTKTVAYVNNTGSKQEFYLGTSFFKVLPGQSINVPETEERVFLATVEGMWTKQGK